MPPGLGGISFTTICHCEEERRSNRMLYRVALLPCDCHASLAMTFFLKALRRQLLILDPFRSNIT